MLAWGACWTYDGKPHAWLLCVCSELLCMCSECAYTKCVCECVCVTLLTQVLTHAAEPYYGRLPTCGAEVDGTC